MPVNPPKKAAIALAKLKAARSPLRPLDQALANERETRERVAENKTRVLSHLKAGAANNTTESLRRDPIADRDIAFEIQQALRLGLGLRLTRRTPPLVTREGSQPHIKNSAHRLRLEEKARIAQGTSPEVVRRRLPVFDMDWPVIERIDRARVRRGETEKVMWVPHWDRTGARLKGFAWAMAVWEARGSALSLDLSNKLVENAEGADRGFANHIRDRLTRELRRASAKLGVPTPGVFFWIEASELGKPHLHGGITVSPDDKHAKVFRDALFRAVCPGATQRSGREVHLKQLTTPAIWANYSAKWWRGSEANLEGRVYAATQPLRVRARDWYCRMRTSEALIPGHAPDEDDIIPL